ncbi:MAG TPA: biotin--[acetyl-CoA-carboxylase] ligase [Flavobacterium sp.]|jgi:BirA family biotin operon repressor/biotin-[acetyl-CoA-carboxylase] ligase
MRLFKLDAIPSTNDFLKELAVKQPLENFTVVTAESQTNGRGQMGAVWHSEVGKNLITSILINNPIVNIKQLFSLNIAVSLAVHDAVSEEVVELSVKWPNDIMAGDKKIGGILIENVIRSGGEITSIIGIGLNVNQMDFTGLDRASSLKLVSNKDYDKEILLRRIVAALEINMEELRKGQPETLFTRYERILFKKGMSMLFREADGSEFTGVITGITPDGRLKILTDVETRVFSLKEVSMLY